MQRADVLAGLTLGEVAEIARVKVPVNFKREKGWTGQLIELCLGASAGSKTQQDFAQLGIELKTIPIDEQGSPLETTYVCYAPLTNIAGIEWQTSSVKIKFSKCFGYLSMVEEKSHQKIGALRLLFYGRLMYRKTNNCAATGKS